jgi:hypothetical protein
MWKLLIAAAIKNKALRIATLEAPDYDLLQRRCGRTDDKARCPLNTALDCCNATLNSMLTPRSETQLSTCEHPDSGITVRNGR